MAAALWLAAGAAASCGGRSELKLPKQKPPAPECDIDADCPGFEDLCEPTRCVDPDDYLDILPEIPEGTLLPPRVCLVVDPIDCDDADACTIDTCVSDTGACTYEPATFDLDGDGFNAPIVGTEPGDPDSCGDDCDDTSDRAFPGALEICDGVDNDCNGVVDDNATFIPLQNQPVRVSGDIAPAGPGGLAYDGETYMSLYTGTSQGFDVYQTRLSAQGVPIAPIEQAIGVQNADSTGGSIKWVGDRYGVAWQDRRDGNYEVYFTLLNRDGAKALTDLRLSVSVGFSVNVQLGWTGSEFVVVWQDDRNGLFEVYAQRVSVDGVPIGGNTLLSNPEGFDDEAPVVAAGTSTVAVAFANGGAGFQQLRYRTFDRETLEPVSDLMDMTDGLSEAVYPTIVWNEDRYLAAWYDRTGTPKAIYAMTFGENGEVITPVTQISNPGQFRSRYPAINALGDRALFVYADDRDGNQGYELYSTMVTLDLVPLTMESRLTNSGFDSIYPVTTFGTDGDVGVLFRDDRLGGAHHVWFTRLGCQTSPNP